MSTAIPCLSGLHIVMLMGSYLASFVCVRGLRTSHIAIMCACVHYVCACVRLFLLTGISTADGTPEYSFTNSQEDDDEDVPAASTKAVKVASGAEMEHDLDELVNAKTAASRVNRARRISESDDDAADHLRGEDGAVQDTGKQLSRTGSSDSDGAGEARPVRERFGFTLCRGSLVFVGDHLRSLRSFVLPGITRLTWDHLSYLRSLVLPEIPTTQD